MKFKEENSPRLNCEKHLKNINQSFRLTKFKKELDEKIHCQIIQYDEHRYVEHDFEYLTEFLNYFDRTKLNDENISTWIIIDNINNENELIRLLSNRFDFQQFLEENLCQNLNERMKLEISDDSSLIYLTMKMIYLEKENNQPDSRSISLILNQNNILLTFQEKNSANLFEIIKFRLKNNRSKIRSLRIDYLFYSILNILFENYHFVLDYYNHFIDCFEKLLIKKLPSNSNKLEINHQTLCLMFQIKHEILSLRVLFQPLKEIIIKLQKTQDRISIRNKKENLYRRQYRRKKRVKRINLTGNYFFNPNTDSILHHWNDDHQMKTMFNEYIFIYFKDLHDQIIQLNDRVDYDLDLISGLISFFILLTDAQRNQIMTFLSLVSNVFIPLNCFTASFAMNFEIMPPLTWKYSYYLLISFLLISTLFTISFFKWKRWL